jgi:hypothetical protein
MQQEGTFSTLLATFYDTPELYQQSNQSVYGTTTHAKENVAVIDMVSILPMLETFVEEMELRFFSLFRQSRAS